MKKIISYLLFVCVLKVSVILGESDILWPSESSIEDFEGSFDDYLSHYFYLIDTNIEGTSIGDQFQQAKVILLLEEHVVGGGQIENADLINRKWNEEDQLLTEGIDNSLRGVLSTTALLKNPKIIDQHRSWDLDNWMPHQPAIRNRNMRTTAKDLIIALCEGSLLLNNETTSNQESDNRFIEVVQEVLEDEAFLNGSDPVLVNISSLLELSHKQRFEYLFSLIPRLQSNVEKSEKLIEQILKDTFLSRNHNMVTEIEENLTKNGYRRLWLTAGELHGQYSLSSYIESVTYLYHSLKQANISYITLKRRKTPGQRSQRELNGKNLNDPLDCKWSHLQFVKGYHSKSSNLFNKWNLETQGFTNAAEWRDWLQNNTHKAFKVNILNDIHARNMLDIFYLYSLNKIYIDNVLSFE